MCPQCRAFISTDDKICPYCQAQLEPRTERRTPSDLLGGLIPHGRFVTMMILLINTGLYIVTVLHSHPIESARQAVQAAIVQELRSLEPAS